MQGCSRQAVGTATCIKLACDLPLVKLPQCMLWGITSKMQQASRQEARHECSTSETREAMLRIQQARGAAEDMKHATVMPRATFKCSPSDESQAACSCPKSNLRLSQLPSLAFSTCTCAAAGATATACQCSSHTWTAGGGFS